MTWYWYLERDDEILIDLDRTTARQLDGIRREIESAHESGSLCIQSVWLYPSAADWHHHLIIKLREKQLLAYRVAWSLVFGNDPRRAARTLLRGLLADAGGPRTANSLLITPEIYGGFYRDTDEQCWCESKHTPHVKELCAAAQRLGLSDELALGSISERWETFGRVWP